MVSLQPAFTLSFDAPTREDESDSVTDQEMYTILSNGRRFAVLQRLADHGGPMEFGELVETVAADEFDVPVGDLDQKQERRVYVALHQNHLPYLEEHGLVEWNRNRGVVRLADATSLDRYLERTDQRGPRSFRSALGLSLLSLCVAVVYLADIGAAFDSAFFDPLLVVTLLLFVAAGVTWLRER